MIRLHYTPPLDWPALLAFLGGRGAAGVESITDGIYRRSAELDGHRGWLAVAPLAGEPVLSVQLSPGLQPVAAALIPRLQRLFDCSLDPAALAASLSADPLLGPVLAAHPGLRVPGAFDGFELVLRAILGQQVTVKAATTLFSRFAQRFGEAIDTPHAGVQRLSPQPAPIAAASLQAIIDLGLTERRARTIHDVAAAVAEGTLRFTPEADRAAERARFAAIPGIGPWTCEYVAMRALRDADAFPDGDLALCKALGGVKPREAARLSERWRPWRAYAAMLLWKRLSMDAGHASAREAGG